METARQKMLARYVDHIYSEGGQYATIARKVEYVCWFLNNTKAGTPKGLRQLMQNNAVMLEGDGKNISGSAAIRDFLSFLNRGDNMSPSRETVQAKQIVDLSGKIIDIYKIQVEAVKVFGQMDEVVSARNMATDLGLIDSDVARNIEP